MRNNKLCGIQEVEGEMNQAHNSDVDCCKDPNRQQSGRV